MSIRLSWVIFLSYKVKYLDKLKFNIIRQLNFLIADYKNYNLKGSAIIN